MNHITISSFRNGQLILMPDNTNRIGIIVQRCIKQPQDPGRPSTKHDEHEWFIRPAGKAQLEVHKLCESHSALLL